MPDFALTSSGNEGSSKMYQVVLAQAAPQIRSVTFNPVLYLSININADEINREMKDCESMGFVQLKQHRIEDGTWWMPKVP